MKYVIHLNNAKGPAEEARVAQAMKATGREPKQGDEIEVDGETYRVMAIDVRGEHNVFER